jgi:TonB family protein
MQMPKRKILLVDYDPRSIKQCKEILNKTFDCEVEVALDGIAALNLFPQVKPDLVIVEAMLPKKHGFEVCHEIKKSAQGKNIPVIIITHVYKGRKYRHQAFHIYCCDEYLEKPISDQFLIDTVKKFLSDTKEAVPQPEKEKAPVEAKVGTVTSEEKAGVPEGKDPVSKESVAALDEKSSVVPNELEKEISSKVDEVLTLFSGTLSEEPSQQPETLQEQKPLEAEVEAKVEEKPKKKKRAKKSKKDKKKKPEPVLAAVAKKEAREEVSESPALKSEEESKMMSLEAEIESEITKEDEKIAEGEGQPQHQEASSTQEEREEEAEAQPEEARTAEQKIEEAIEAKLGVIEKFEAPQEQESQEEIAQEEPLKEEEIKEEVIDEEIETAEERGQEAEVQEPLEEVSEEIPEEILASAPPKKSFFKSGTFFIGLSVIVVLGIIFILFPMFKGKKEDSAPVQAVASIPSSLIEEEKAPDTDSESSVLDSVISSPEQEQEQMPALEGPATTETSTPVSQLKQPEAASKKSTSSVKPKARETIKQQSKKTAAVKAPPVTERKQEKIHTPSPQPTKTSQQPSKKPASDKVKIAPAPQAVSSSTEEKKDLPSSTKQDSIKLSEKPVVKKEPVTSPKQTATQKATEAPQKQKITPPEQIPQKVPQDSQKQKELVEEPLEPAPQPEEPPLPKIGQLVDYSLLDREPPYLAHDPPKYPVLARLKGIEGRVNLKVLIKESGYVEEVKLIKGLDESVDEAAIKAAYNWVYRPPTSQGVRVKTWKTEIFTFPPK